MKKIKFVLIPAVLSVLLFVWLFPQLPQLWWAENHRYIRYEKLLLADQEIPPRQLYVFRSSAALAKKKITDFWGSQKGNSKLIFCSEKATFNELCRSNEGAGCSIGTPWGSWIILNTDGLNENVIAHEMSHIELMTRLGWWNVKTQIPTWLDEGLALQIDDRFVSEKDSIQRYIDYKSELEMYTLGRQWAVPLKDLETNRQFFGGNEADTRVAYLTAATEVAGILTRISKKELIMELEKEKKIRFSDTNP